MSLLVLPPLALRTFVKTSTFFLSRGASVYFFLLFVLGFFLSRHEKHEGPSFLLSGSPQESNEFSSSSSGSSFFSSFPLLVSGARFLPPRVEEDVEIRKPIEDTKQYKYIKLKNGIKCVLISSSDVDMAALAVTVHVGSISDPADAQGLAHLIEHLLFQGSSKFPAREELDKFVHTNGGYSNAFTSLYHVLLHLEIPYPLLESAAERAADAFTAPLLNPSYMREEIDVIQSEFDAASLDDFWRVTQILRKTPRFPHLDVFQVGNWKSLVDIPESKGLSVYDTLKDFHNKLYSSNLMSLAVIGRESLDDLETMVRKNFESVEDKGLQPLVFPSCSSANPVNLPFSLNSLAKQLTYIVPTADVHQMLIVFYIPPTLRMWRTKSHEYVTNLLAHECSTCLASKLKREELITALIAGTDDDESCSKMQLTVNLTEKGTRNTERIGELIFLYLRYMNVVPVEKSRYEEFQGVALQNFTYAELLPPLGLVTSIAENLFHYPPSEVLSGPALFYEFNEEEISSLLSIMTSQNARVLLIDKEYAPRCRDTEMWYGTKYVVEERPEKTRSLWELQDSLTLEEAIDRMQQEGMAFPKPSAYIVTDFHLYSTTPPDPSSSSEPVYPKLLTFPKTVKGGEGGKQMAAEAEDVDSGGLGVRLHPCSKEDTCKIFYKQDTTFRVPKTIVELLFYFKSSIQFTPREIFLTGLYVSSLELILTEELADAELAGYSVGVSAGTGHLVPVGRHGWRTNAIAVSVGGFSQHVPRLLLEVISTISKRNRHKLTQPFLDLSLGALRRGLRTLTYARSAASQADDALALLLVHPYITHEELLEYAENTQVTLQELQDWTDEIWNHVAVEGLIQGNILEDETTALMTEVLERLEINKISPYAEIGNYRVFGLKKLTSPPSSSRGELGGTGKTPWATDMVSTPDNSQDGAAGVLTRLRYDVANINPEDPQNHASLYIQLEEATPRRRALMTLVQLWLSDKAFDDLRTKQQLGYSAGFGHTRQEHTRYLTFFVTTPYDPSFVATRIEAFLSAHPAEILTQEEVEVLRKAAISVYETRFRNLSEEFSFNRGYVVTREFEFDARKKIREELTSISLEDIAEFRVTEMEKSPWVLVEVRSQVPKQGNGVSSLTDGPAWEELKDNGWITVGNAQAFRELHEH